MIPISPPQDDSHYVFTIRTVKNWLKILHRRALTQVERAIKPGIFIGYGANDATHRESQTLSSRVWPHENDEKKYDTCNRPIHKGNCLVTVYFFFCFFTHVFTFFFCVPTPVQVPFSDCETRMAELDHFLPRTDKIFANHSESRHGQIKTRSLFSFFHL